ncbi:hypothetical protein [Streptomyces sp. NPDC101178]|uniref:hypothetical protein n=1 Tax=Streptomyces sp. NPDC101178 TaxID=3366124 RepID=UPI0037F3C005
MAVRGMGRPGPRGAAGRRADAAAAAADPRAVQLPDFLLPRPVGAASVDAELESVRATGADYRAGERRLLLIPLVFAEGCRLYSTDDPEVLAVSFQARGGFRGTVS